MKKLPNLESTFSKSDTNWKNKTPIILTETLRMVIYLSRNFLQTQSFFIVSNQKQMLFVLGKTGSRETKLLNFKRSSKTFTQHAKAISNYIYLLYHSEICFHSTLLYQPIRTNRNPWAAVYFQSTINYSNDTFTLPFTLQLCYKPLGILQRVIKNK